MPKLIAIAIGLLFCSIPADESGTLPLLSVPTALNPVSNFIAFSKFFAWTLGEGPSMCEGVKRGGGPPGTFAHICGSQLIIYQ